MRYVFASFSVICSTLIGAAYFDAIQTVASVIELSAVEISQADVVQPDVPQLQNTAKIERGNLLCTVSATGIVKPEELVEVGAQVTGMIESFGCDPNDRSKQINYGSVVSKGAVLAKIDQTVYQAKVDHAKASIEVASASLAKLLAKCDQLKHDWLRAKALVPEKAVSDTEYGLAEMQYRVAEKEVKIGEAVVQQNRATLCIAQSDLDHTVIKSPIDGVVVDRRVDIGQTVVASFNAPGLFLIAKNLQQMQIWASVDENDIRWIRPGLAVRFTLDSRPAQVFGGQVAQLRLNAQRTEGHAAYTVVIDVKDSAGMLPYQTANIHFEVLRRPNVLLVPTEAVKAQSQPARVHENANIIVDLTSARTKKAPVSLPILSPENGDCESSDEPIGEGCLLIKDGDRLRTVDVETGFSNGTVVEIRSDEIAEGMVVVY